MEANPNHRSTEKNVIEAKKGKERVALISGTQMERPLRHLAGLIEEHSNDNYEVDIINLGTPANVYEHKDGGYPEELVQEILTFLKEKKPKTIGFTMIDFGVERLSEVIRRISEDADIQANGTKIIAGGPFAIEHSDRCIQIPGIDVVCYAQGWSFAQIIEARNIYKDFDEIPGLLVKKGVMEGGEAYFTETPPPDPDITMLQQPLPDESYENTYRIHDGSLVNAADSGGAIPVEHHQFAHKNTGVLVISYGCPNTCDFCSVSRMYDEINAALLAEAQEKREYWKIQPKRKKNKDTGEWEDTKEKELKVQFRMQRVEFLPPARAIELIKNYLEHNPKTEYLMFNDNDFASRNPNPLAEFCSLYKAQIGLPFYCQCSPNSLNIVKIDALCRAGMDTLDIGVQGSEKSNENAKYERHIKDKHVLDAAKHIAPFLEKRDAEGNVTAEGVKFACDFINGNKMHTKEDMLSTLDLVKKITQEVEGNSEGTGSWNLAIHNLTLDADVKLAQIYNEKQRKEGVSVGEVEDSDYHNATIEAFYKIQEPYLNILLQWMAGVHDQVRVGRLPRHSKDFIVQFGDVINEDQKLRDLIETKSQTLTETVQLLTDEDVYEYLGGVENEHGKDLLKRIHSKLSEIQWVAGVHDQVRIGRLPQKSEDFIRQFTDVLEKDSKLRELIEEKSKTLTETTQLLVDGDVYQYLDGTNTLGLGEIHYSYQRPDRYDYDYSWAEEQIRARE